MDELQQDHPLSDITRQWLGMDNGVQLPPDEDVNSIPFDDEEYLRTFEGADDDYTEGLRESHFFTLVSTILYWVQCNLLSVG